MGTAHLQIDLGALAANWRALDAASGPDVETAAVVKADGYGLGIAPVATTLRDAGARTFFLAVAEEGAAARAALGPDAAIMVFSGHMPGDAPLLREHALIPMLNSIEQMTRHFEALPGHPFGVQLDSGMNRLGLEPVEWAAARDLVMAQRPVHVMSHLACADDPADAANARQRDAFRSLTEGLGVPLSLGATGGVLLGRDYHFDVTRPGIGLYGGLPFAEARAVVRLTAPVIQVRDVAPGEIVGYGGTWRAERPTRVATLSAGYADGIIRAMGNRARLWHGATPCPLVGRVSMDLLTADVSHLPEVPEALDILGPQGGIDDLAEAAGTIGYEILTALGARYHRTYL